MRQRERALAACCPVMARLIEAVGPCTWELRADLPPFQTLARAIAHQQLNGVAAERIFARFKALYAPAPFPEPARCWRQPRPRCAPPASRSPRSPHCATWPARWPRGVVPATDELHALESDAIIERLTQVRGIGRWTVEMLLMFQLGRPDVLPVDDFGVCNGFRLTYGLKGMPRPRALAEFGARWAPQPFTGLLVLVAGHRIASSREAAARQQATAGGAAREARQGGGGRAAGAHRWRTKATARKAVRRKPARPAKKRSAKGRKPPRRAQRR